MSSQMSRRIFHVVFADDWEGAQRFGEYEGSTRAKTFDEVGFIHAATAEQLEYVLTHVYGDVDLPLVVVVIDEDALREAGVDTRWEAIAESSSTPGTQAPRITSTMPLDPDIVVAAIPLGDRDGGRWMVPDVSGVAVGGSTP